MPTYEYLCKNCGNRFEIWQKMSDEPLTECSQCKGSIARVIYTVGIHFKGSGFYNTDHRKEVRSESEAHGEAKKADTADKTASASETKSTESGTDSSTNTSSSSTNSTGSSTTSGESKAAAPAGK